MRVSEIIGFDLPEEVCEILREEGIEEFYPPQEECLRKGVLDGKSMIICTPTASGKTLVAELAMLKSILKRGGKCLYIVPLRAIAEEKYDDFCRKYSRLGIKVGISTGDYDTADPRLATYDILVATSERVDSLLRHRAKWLADLVSVVVVDEIHLIGDASRGPTLEVLISRLKQVNPNVQLIGLSATVRNAEELAGWLNAELVRSEWRPVPLKKGVYVKGEIIFDDGSRKRLAKADDPIFSLVMDTIREEGQVLIFVNTRKSSQNLAVSLAEKLPLEVRVEAEKLEEVAERIERALDEPTRTCKLLSACVRRGTAFHHAGLHVAQRREVEKAFKNGLIKIVCATPTLAMGVNLPSRRVIIRNYQRYDLERGMEFITVQEFHQLCGRAGRPGYDSYGEAVLLAGGEDEAEILFEEYIKAPPERIISKLGVEPAIRSHVLACIAAGYARTLDGLRQFFSQTFFSYQRSVRDVIPLVERILDFLENEKMIEKIGETYRATRFGELVSSLYIDPLTGVRLRDGLKAVTAPPTDFGILHMICHVPDMPLLPLGRNDEVLEGFLNAHATDLLYPLPDPDSGEYEILLREVKTAKMLLDWIEEKEEDSIHEEFNVGAGDLRRYAETAEWLLHSAHELARLFNVKKALKPLREIQLRMRYGIKKELIELVQLRGIGRVRARSLFNAGYRTLGDLKKASVHELARVPHLGPELAKRIKEQVS